MLDPTCPTMNRSLRGLVIDENKEVSVAESKSTGILQRYNHEMLKCKYKPTLLFFLGN